MRFGTKNHQRKGADRRSHFWEVTFRQHVEAFKNVRKDKYEGTSFDK